MNKQKGFTIIELIVVVAIIAVLAGIVLVNVTQYIAKGKNSAIQGNMATILTNAAIWYDQNSSAYTNFDGDPTYEVPAASVGTNGGTIMNTITASAACFCSTMNVTNTEATGTTYCVDTTGAKVKKVQTCAVACPAAGACVP